MTIRLVRAPYLYILFAPWALFGIGFALNALVMAMNGAQMPVMFPGWDASYLTAGDFRHVAMTSATHLNFLGDWIVVRDAGTYSIGDLFILAWAATKTLALGAWIALVVKKAVSHEQ